MDANFSDWIGRSLTREDIVTPRLLAEYRSTMATFLFDPDGDTCPPGFHFGLAPATPAMLDTGPDGAERKGLFLPPIPLPRRMWAGGAIETVRSLRLNAAVTRVSTITDIRVKRGSSGELCLVSVLHEIADGQGLAIRERQDLVFREAASAPASAPGSEQPLAADWSVEATPLMLFRFSAFTFNGHRIHYDLRHAAEEGYPGLLVHGPMQAALMLNLASLRLGHVPSRFDYRCLAPLYAGARFGVAHAEAGKTRIIRSDGVTAAEGQAHARGTG
ncbi:MaoC family dehydratase N-terminal domain-containing protein [Aestuariivirga sp.]|uniref:FAS1-like dehydratase domain-containing protein n=1 Tax=Aestuariivirga sp. TaxID=2650926 RepID=UPI00391C3AB8